LVLTRSGGETSRHGCDGRHRSPVAGFACAASLNIFLAVPQMFRAVLSLISPASIFASSLATIVSPFADVMASMSSEPMSGSTW
jgi:hypothetical protein